MSKRGSCIAALFLATWCRLAVAQPSAGDRAVALGRQGVALYEEQSFAEAYERFALAEREAHSPVFVLYMARCRAALGHLVDARSLYRSVSAEAIAAAAPAPWRHAQSQARGELEVLEPRIPSLRIEVVNGPATVVLDDRIVRDIAQPIELDPGEHHVEARAGDRSAKETVTLDEGERETVSLVLPAPEAAAAPENGDLGYTVAGGVLVGLGGAGLIVGAVTGGMALSITSDIKDRCVGDSCLIADRADADRANRFATASTISFIVGGVAAAAGTVLLLLPVVMDPATTAELALGVGTASVRLSF